MTSEITEKLRKIAGKDNIGTDHEILQKYSKDETLEINSHFSEVATYPGSAKQVSEIVKLANRMLIPIILRGTEMGLSRNAICNSCIWKDRSLPRKNGEDNRDR